MYLIYYDEDLNTLESDFCQNIAEYLKCKNYYILNNNQGISKTSKIFKEIKNKYDMIITNEVLLLNAYLPQNIYIYKKFKLYKIQDLTNRQLRPSHNLVKLYLAGEFNRV